MDEQQRGIVGIARDFDLFQIKPLPTSATLFAGFAPRPLDENPAHGLGCGGKKVGAIGELHIGILAGEPQRVTRYGKEAVVIVSEQEWRARPRSAPTLGALLARYARAGALGEDATDRPWTERPLGGGPT